MSSINWDFLKQFLKYQTNQYGNEKSAMISYLSPGNKLVPVFLRIFYHKEDEGHDYERGIYKDAFLASSA